MMVVATERADMVFEIAVAWLEVQTRLSPSHELYEDIRPDSVIEQAKMLLRVTWLE